MIYEAIILAAFILGVPLPESAARPIAEAYELTQPGIRWYFEPSDLQSLALKASKLPRLREGGHLPTSEVCLSNYTFNRAHNTWLQRQLEINVDRPGPWRIWLAENELLGKFWLAARDSQMEYYYPVTRRESLAEAKKLIHPDLWRLGDWPDTVPTWRFTCDD